jgi:hypothetical protein
VNWSKVLENFGHIVIGRDTLRNDVSLFFLITSEKHNPMALIQYSGLVSDVRGKLNGSVASRNKGGAYLRNKVTPINPATSHQTLQRSQISNVSKQWSQLTQAQRDGWTAYGGIIGAKSIFGNSKILSGIATYQRINQIVLTAGGARIDTAPITSAVTSILSLSLVANHTGPLLTLTFSPSPLAGTVGTYIFATPAMSPGIKNINTHLRFLNFTAAATSPLELHVAWIARFGAFPSTASGQRIGLQVQIVDTSSGAISAAATVSTLVI